jgi:hypothetical protein
MDLVDRGIDLTLEPLAFGTFLGIGVLSKWERYQDPAIVRWVSHLAEATEF